MAKRVIVNRFRELLAVKGRKERRTISQRDVAKETGLAKTTVDTYARNEVTRYDQHVVLIFCEYLNCKPGDFLVIEEIEDPEWRTPQPA